MTICSRRTLQRLINENAKFLPRRQLRTLVDKLNNNDTAASKGHKPSLATEWEIILLNVFSCRIPDHHIVPSRSPLLLAREVFRKLAGDRNVTDREVSAC